MNVLFAERRLRTDKLAPMYLSAVLEQAGHKVDMVQDEIDNLDNYVLDADAVLWSVMSADAPWAFKRNRELKERYQFKSIIGGPHATFFSEQCVADGGFDQTVIGPGESVICELLEGSASGGASVGYLPDVNSLPFPSRSHQYKYPEFGQARMKRFIAGRYCLYSCKYCYNHSFKRLYKGQQKGLLQRVQAGRMIEEVLQVRRDYGLELAYFNDDDLANSPEWLVEFCHYMDKANMQFCGSIRANSVNHDTLKLLASSGCVFLNIALESARESTQKFLRRGMITNQQVMDACLWAEELGIKVRLQNMIGLPVDNPLGDALETLEFNQRVNPADSWASIFQPYVGTDLYNYCIDNGLIDASTIPGTFYDGTVLDIPDAEKINRLQRWWYFAVKHQLPRELVEILLNVPIPDEQNKQINDYRWREAARNLYGL